MTTRILTALYDEKGPAESARDDLLALGVGPEDVAVRASSGLDPAGGPLDDPFWSSIGDVVLPEADRHVYDEAVRRGGFLVVAWVPEERAERASGMLEHLNPVDLDERTEAWRRSGWPGPATTATPVAQGGEPALAHPTPPPGEDPTRVGGFGDSIAYAAEPGGYGTVRRRVRSYGGR